MNKRQLEVEKAKLEAEKQQLNHLKGIYKKASDDITNKIKISNGKINVLMKDFDNLDETQKSILQSQIYQRNFQQSLKKQIDGFMKELESDQYSSVSEYLKKCYDTGYVGVMYDIAGQGIPLIMPIDQKKVTKAMVHDTKLSKKLYTKLGEDVNLLKKRIANNISRGIATADSYANIARNIANGTKVGINKTMTIARTEGHRIQCTAAFDAQYAAKDAGADIVKQWDSTLDGKTRETHRQLDGQIRELDEPFEVGGMTAMYPSDFGDPAEDINCRCALLQRARWALDEDELQTLQERAAYFGLDKTNSFNDFKDKYLKASPNAPIEVDISGVRCKKEIKPYGFGDGSGGIKKTIDATIYTTPDGTQFMFPKRYNKKKQTMTPELAIECWNKVPSEIRKQAQKIVEFVDYYNPQDSYWKKRYKNFTHSYATGGDKITFYRHDYAHNPDYVTRTYSHEAGHYIDRQKATTSTRFSEENAWKDAMAADQSVSGKKSPTTYGENAPTEDFAESIAEYVGDKKKFKTNFPNRAAILEKIVV